MLERASAVDLLAVCTVITRLMQFWACNCDIGTGTKPSGKLRTVGSWCKSRNFPATTTTETWLAIGQKPCFPLWTLQAFANSHAWIRLAFY
jgi:hypothetical protein